MFVFFSANVSVSIMSWVSDALRAPPERIVDIRPQHRMELDFRAEPVHKGSEPQVGLSTEFLGAVCPFQMASPDQYKTPQALVNILGCAILWGSQGSGDSRLPGPP